MVINLAGADLPSAKVRVFTTCSRIGDPGEVLRRLTEVEEQLTAACLLVRSPACYARQLQTNIVQVVRLCPTGFREGPWERLELHKPKGLRVVLRALGSSNAPRLPDIWVGSTQVYPAREAPA